MVQRIFQDPAGTIPAIFAGQPVGLVKRMAGTVDASQATVAAKPTLARWPMTGRRNIANFSASPAGNQFWANAPTGLGITITKIGTGFEGGVPYVDYSAAGTATAIVFLALTQGNEGISPLNNMSARVTARRIGGSSAILETDGLRLITQRLTSVGTPLSTPAAASGFVRDQVSDVDLMTSGDMGSDPQAVSLRSRVEVVISQGVTIDAIWRVKGFQSTALAAQTPLQLNYGPNDITEPGVPDLWHLYNDGGDALTAVLPAGTYGVANLAIDRSYRMDSLVSDGTTPITTLFAERQIDAIYRFGAFSTQEQAAILSYWEEEYPL